MFRFLFDHWPIIFVALTVLIAWLLAKLVLGPEKLPYQKRASLLTESELTFYRALSQAVNGQWSIHAMVRLADLIQVRPQTPKFQAWQNRIHAKHVDFLLCDQGSMEAKLALELDDRTHERPDRQRRDEFVDQALADAGVPLLRVDVGESYDPAALRKTIDERLTPERHRK
jgi:very-short-patch-repair endonuclease